MTSFLIMNSLGPFEISRHIHLSNVHIMRIEMFECSIHGKRWFQDVCSALEWCVGFFIWIDLGPCSESDSLPYSSLAESDLIDWEPKNSKNHNNYIKIWNRREIRGIQWYYWKHEKMELSACSCNCLLIKGPFTTKN